MPIFFFKSLTRVTAAIHCLQTGVSRALRWCSLLMIVVVCIVLIGRLFNLGSTALQESIGYFHGTMFMLCLAYTAQVEGHVRVDIFYRRFKSEQKAWVNLLGSCIFLLPFAVFLSGISWQGAYQSWQIKESSINPGGLPLVYFLKALAPATGVLLVLHALSHICIQLIKISTLSDDRQPKHPNN